MRRLRAPGHGLAWTPLEPDRARHAPAGQDHDRGPLEYLHAHWAPADTFDPATVGGGVRGRVVALVGRITYRVLGPYFRHEREVLAHLVQANEALEQRCDELVRRQHDLEEALVARQVAEARNLSDLAAVLDSGTRATAGSALDRAGSDPAP